MIQYVDADEVLRSRISDEWGEKVASHMHLTDGFSIVALHRSNPVGLISTYWKRLPLPLDEDFDAYIDILDVHRDFRRQGIPPTYRTIHATSKTGRDAPDTSLEF